MHSVGVWKSLSCERISGTLKFGFLQTNWSFLIADASNSILERLYKFAERWLRETASANRNSPIVGRYAIYLFRIPATEFTLIPIRQPSDVEQNCVIEIVLTQVEANQHTHSLQLCQLNIPTDCSRCTGFIVGFYKQGFRCKKCRMTFHKDCVPLLANDCPAPSTDPPQPSRTARPREALTFIYPLVADAQPPSPQPPLLSPTGANYGPTENNGVGTLKIIERGIFPACIRGTQFSRRFLFRMTLQYLSITSNTSPANVAQSHISIPSADDGETIIPLNDITSLVLTHLKPEHDDVFEIHLQNRTILSVGKNTDSDELQMQTAQFYSAMRDQHESLINSASTSTASSASSVSATNQPGKMPSLKLQKSMYRITPNQKDNDQTDLHDLYTLTGEKIGEGAFGRVVSAYKKLTRQEVAVKIIEKLNCSEQQMQLINDEAKNLYKFNHMNILKLEAYYERKDAVYLVTERMETDLCQYIMKQSAGRLDEDLSRMIIYQLIVAVRYLHNKDCGHLDIKCENILITLLPPKAGSTGELASLECPLVKLADFGYSRIIRENSFRKTRVGTKVYSAPEIYRGAPGYNRQADLWSVGIVMYAALSGTLPYDERGFQRAEEIVSDREQLFSGQQWATVSKDAKDLIAEKLLVIQTGTRITANSALFEVWFTEFKLYTNLREIERRTRFCLEKRKETFPSGSHWLTQERRDIVWVEFEQMYSQRRTILEN